MHIIIFFPVFQRKKKLNGSEMDKIWKQKEILAKRAEVKIEERKEKHYKKHLNPHNSALHMIHHVKFHVLTF